jgi:tRNA dimethylallyltransferase
VTGTRFTATLPDPTPYYPSVQIGVDLDTSVLDERIARRVARMWRDGLVEETRELARQGLREGRTASRALGYQQVLRYLAGECAEEQAAADTVQATRRFVRRQRSWFRRDPCVRWLDAAAPEAARAALREIERGG